ncbi:hypothetical protein GCM10008018_45180 [Paenibacillus marchantiophytorum]|uniref:Type I restriction modification DNA specificity domain-containing protein n=1 Tax=Paenibacillus marchantiophytorum TaxID=1619310 RepID=A0ABQ1EZH1_9BACL|nr:restriction endonuclease subunit S [Paenibacillus marchantiophytorum]GFZ93746.1 hypothetical protein GCM10008018_45180 [Paenibacillus marchantiophytorum]
MINLISGCDVSVDRLDPYYYRRTVELKSVLSEDEKYTLLSELCDEITDGSRKARDFADHGIPYLRVSNLTSGGIDVKFAKFISSTTDIEKKAIISSGDILISKVASIWKVAFVDEAMEGAVISPDLIKIRPKDKESRDLLMKFLMSEIGRLSFSRMVTQSVIPKISVKQVSHIKVPFVITDVGDLSDKQQIEERRNLKTQIQMYYEIDDTSSFWEMPKELWINERLASDRLDVPYYQYLNSSLNQALSERLKREKWVKLKQMATVIKNTVSPSEFSKKEISYIGMKNINKETFVVESVENVLFNTVSSRARFRVKERDILLGIVGPTIGGITQSLAFVPSSFHDAIASSVFAVIRPVRCSTYYLLWCLIHPLVRFQFRMHCFGTTQQMLSTHSLLDTYVPLLNQEKVAEIEKIMRVYTGGV